MLEEVTRRTAIETFRKTFRTSYRNIFGTTAKGERSVEVA
jgi:hypothetical protein